LLKQLLLFRVSSKSTFRKNHQDMECNEDKHIVTMHYGWLIRRLTVGRNRIESSTRIERNWDENNFFIVKSWSYRMKEWERITRVWEKIKHVSIKRAERGWAKKMKLFFKGARNEEMILPKLNEIESYWALRYTKDRWIGLDTLKHKTTMLINDASNRKAEISRRRNWTKLFLTLTLNNPFVRLYHRVADARGRCCRWGKSCLVFAEPFVSRTKPSDQLSLSRASLQHCTKGFCHRVPVTCGGGVKCSLVSAILVLWGDSSSAPWKLGNNVNRLPMRSSIMVFIHRG
jgi:hypothetical protein